MSKGEKKIDIVAISYDVVLALLSSLILISGIALALILCRRKSAEAEDQAEPEPAKPAAPSYPLTDIHAATDGFSHRRIIGSGRLGTVYAAVMPRGELIAAKRIHPRLLWNNNNNNNATGLGFSSSLKWLSSADHPHVVPVVGFSEGPGERVVLMEFGGILLSLDFYLHQNTDGPALLDWGRRARIAAGAARGIDYLHNGPGGARPVIHGCVKPSNVLIDVKFCGRVSDYGLHFLAPRGERGGLEGYVDGEYWREGESKECDVFGFGVVLLELLSGRKSERGLIVVWAMPLIKGSRFGEFLDRRLPIPSSVEPLVRLARVALACVGNCRKNRPSISQVATILSDLETSL